jgi:hypothetical protein
MTAPFPHHTTTTTKGEKRNYVCTIALHDRSNARAIQSKDSELFTHLRALGRARSNLTQRQSASKQRAMDQQQQQHADEERSRSNRGDGGGIVSHGTNSADTLHMAADRNAIFAADAAAGCAPPLLEVGPDLGASAGSDPLSGSAASSLPLGASADTYKVAEALKSPLEPISDVPINDVPTAMGPRNRNRKDRNGGKGGKGRWSFDGGDGGRSTGAAPSGSSWLGRNWPLLDGDSDAIGRGRSSGSGKGRGRSSGSGKGRGQGAAGRSNGGGSGSGNGGHKGKVAPSTVGDSEGSRVPFKGGFQIVAYDGGGQLVPYGKGKGKGGAKGKGKGAVRRRRLPKEPTHWSNGHFEGKTQHVIVGEVAVQCGVTYAKAKDVIDTYRACGKKRQQIGWSNMFAFSNV